LLSAHHPPACVDLCTFLGFGVAPWLCCSFHAV
jgi:hypothetical protein